MNKPQDNHHKDIVETLSSILQILTEVSFFFFFNKGMVMRSSLCAVDKISKKKIVCPFTCPSSSSQQWYECSIEQRWRIAAGRIGGNLDAVRKPVVG